MVNKKYRVYSLVIGFLVVNSLSFSMHNIPKIIYYGSKVITTSFIPLAAIKLAQDSSNKFAEEIAFLNDMPERTPIIYDWSENIIKKNTNYHTNEVAVTYGKDWSCTEYKNQKYIVVPIAESLLLESALEQDRRQKLTYVESLKEFFCESSRGQFLISNDNYKEYIDESSMILKHEIGHLVANDPKNNQRAKILIPFAVEAVCLSSTYSFNKMYKVLSPTTIRKSLGRSMIAFGGIIPKLCLCSQIYLLRFRYREAQADKFACEHAETKNELKALYTYLRQQHVNFEKKYHSEQSASTDVIETNLRSKYKTIDPIHPYPADRAEMVKKYIDEWDTNHPADKATT